MSNPVMTYDHAHVPLDTVPCTNPAVVRLHEHVVSRFKRMSICMGAQASPLCSRKQIGSKVIKIKLIVEVIDE
jgi:hypothetical protein